MSRHNPLKCQLWFTKSHRIAHVELFLKGESYEINNLFTK